MVVNIDWKQLIAFTGIAAAVNSGYTWVLYHVLRDKLDGIYMKKEECDANHKVTDMAIVAMRDDIREMKETNNKILNLLLEASSVFPKNKHIKKRKS